ncbi:MAG: hypothetical protein H6R19_2482 [Proteobacteria bacterium]|nr:hypothetical protein [Pseudomonadota bacterium]
MKQSELIEIAQMKVQPPVQAELFRATGISRSRLTDLRNDRRPISNDEARRLAEVAGLNPLAVIGELEIERATDEATRTAWGKALASLKRSACAFALAVLASLGAFNGGLQTSAPGGFLRRR